MSADKTQETQQVDVQNADATRAAFDALIAGKAEVSEITFEYRDKDGNLIQTVHGRAATQQEKHNASK